MTVFRPMYPPPAMSAALVWAEYRCRAHWEHTQEQITGDERGDGGRQRPHPNGIASPNSSACIQSVQARKATIVEPTRAPIRRGSAR